MEFFVKPLWFDAKSMLAKEVMSVLNSWKPEKVRGAGFHQTGTQVAHLWPSNNWEICLKNVFLFANIVPYNCKISVWNWLNTMII